MSTVGALQASKYYKYLASFEENVLLIGKSCRIHRQVVGP